MKNRTKKQNIRFKIFLSLLIVLVLAAGTTGYWYWQKDRYHSILVDIDQKHPTDRRTFRTFNLPNELEVLLISDPDATQSSAAIDIDVGSYANPPEYSGMAHFLEHMLFLGTEKYPQEGEYQQYIKDHGGSRNGETGGDYSTYYFTINPDAFEGALDRFAQFFIAPTFNEKFFDREKMAIESEYQLYLQDDGRRIGAIRNSLKKTGHPMTRFSIGNAETLKPITRDILSGFYRKYYTANQMKLALLSKDSLDQQKAWVKQIFSAIPNNHREHSAYDPQIYNDGALPRLVQIKPLRDVKMLGLSFVVPNYLSYWKSAPQVFINYFMSYSGENSFVSYLKKNDLVTSVDSSFSEMPFATFYGISFELTNNGVAQYQKIIELFFGYVNLLKKEGLKNYSYDEKKKMAELRYVYRNHAEGSDVVIYFTDMMWHYNPLEIEKKDSLFYQADPHAFMTFLNALDPQNFDATFIAPGAVTDQIEPFFHGEYSVNKISDEEINSLRKAVIDSAVHYPAPNPYIPDKLTQLTNDPKTTPYKVLDDDRGVFWFMQDKNVKLPKAIIDILIQTEGTNATPRASLVSALYTSAFAKSCEEWAEPFSFAGLGYDIDRNDRGIDLSTSGYSEKLPQFTQDLIHRLTQITLTEKEFAAIKVNYQRSFDNFDLGKANSQASYHLGNILSKHSFHRDEYMNLLDSITLDEVKKFALDVYKNISVEGEAYGNLNPTSLTEITDNLFTALKSNLLPSEKRSKYNTVKIKEGEPRVYSRVSRDNNYGWTLFIPVGPRTAQNKAITGILKDYLNPLFFNEMRTHRQYAYSLNVGSGFYKDVVGLTLGILSPKHDATYLDQQILDWLNQQATTMDQIPAEKLDTLKKSLITLLEQEDKTISEWFDYVNSVAFLENGNANYRQDFIEAIKQVTPADLKAALTRALAPETANYLTVHVSPQDRPAPAPTETPIYDIATFKKGAEVW